MTSKDNCCVCLVQAPAVGTEQNPIRIKDEGIRNIRVKQENNCESTEANPSSMEEKNTGGCLMDVAHTELDISTSDDEEDAFVSLDDEDNENDEYNDECCDKDCKICKKFCPFCEKVKWFCICAFLPDIEPEVEDDFMKDPDYVFDEDDVDTDSD